MKFKIDSRNEQIRPLLMTKLSNDEVRTDQYQSHAAAGNKRQMHFRNNERKQIAQNRSFNLNLAVFQLQF